jgi:hypothetical protein
MEKIGPDFFFIDSEVRTLKKQILAFEFFFVFRINLIINRRFLLIFINQNFKPWQV